MDSLNLLLDPWIPVRHRSGARSWRAAWDVFAEQTDDPAVALASPRADFDGGLAQLLIGLLQTVYAPADDDAWAELAARPPDAAELRRRLEPLASAFELLGVGPRFLQDVRVPAVGGDAWSVEKLLIDLGLDVGADHFSRNGSVGSFCLPCAAAALTTLQTSAPSGGRGHNTSMRGGGPLTTLVVSAAAEATLWTNVWLNVVPLSVLRAEPPDLASIERVFPWMASHEPGEPTRAPELTPEDAHPLQTYFGMPRRLWLGQPQTGDCGLCGRTELPTLADYQARPNGIRYTGAWIHPLSPYRRFQEQQLAVKGNAAGIGYSDWLGLVVSPEGSEVQSALNVKELLRGGVRFEHAKDLRLWAFGYAMDNMKPKAWSEGRMPIYKIDPGLAAAFAAEVRMLVEGAEKVESYARFAFKKLVARRPKDVRREPIHLSTRFWEETETPFYKTARDLLDELGKGADPLPLRQRWHFAIAREALALFESEVAEADFRATSPAQVARAHNELKRAVYGKQIKQILELPTESSKKKGGKR